MGMSARMAHPKPPFLPWDAERKYPAPPASFDQDAVIALAAANVLDRPTRVFRSAILQECHSWPACVYSQVNSTPLGLFASSAP
jgi:hypothetical protein